MSLKKSDTLDLADNPVSQSWGRLHPVAAQLSLPTYDLREPETIIGRNPECTIIIPDKRLSGRHCSLSLRGDKVIATDLSTNGTFINDRKIGKGVEKEIEDDEYLWVLPVAKVEVSQAIGFKIEIIAVRERKSNMLKEQEAKEAERVEEARKKEQELKDEEIRKELEAKKKAEKVNNDFAQSIKEQITCSFCYEIMCVPVSIQPCNHRFCGGCLTELVNSKKDTCIQCRKEITTAVRDAAFSSIIEDYLKTHPTERRDAKDE